MTSIGTPHRGFATGGVHYEGLGYLPSVCGGNVSSVTQQFKNVTCRACKSKLHALSQEIAKDVPTP